MEITSSSKCTGCSLCAFSCPAGAIQLQYKNDSMFLNPTIDETKCIGCTKCVLICPSNNSSLVSEQKRCFLAQEQNIESLKKSTSGGIASALAKQFVKNGGIVYGAAFNADMQLEHVRCVTENDCERIKGSKYIQSNMVGVLDQIDTDLRKGIPILFIGTPCQCDATKRAFYQYKYFYCCDFICNGVASPLLFKKHVIYLESLYDCKIKNYVFRPKTEKYLEPYEMFFDAKGFQYRIKSPWKKWGSIYYAGLAMRSSCFECLYALEERVGNITFSDIPLSLIQTSSFDFPHNISEFGASLISINDEKGNQLLHKIDETVYLKEVDTHLIDKNKHMSHDICKRDLFCLQAKTSFEKAKYNHLGLKLKIRSQIMEVIEYLRKK